MNLDTNLSFSIGPDIHRQELIYHPKSNTGFVTIAHTVPIFGLKLFILLVVTLLSAVNLFSQPRDANARFVGSQNLDEAEPLLFQGEPPVAVRTQMMMFNSYGKPTWALVMGGMMITGAVIMASADNDEDEDSDDMSDVAPAMMGVMGTGMLIYYFLSDDVPGRAQLAKSSFPQLWNSSNLSLSGNGVRATATWRW